MAEEGAITAKGHTEGSEWPSREQSQPRGTQRAANSRGGSNHSQGAHRGQRTAEEGAITAKGHTEGSEQPRSMLHTHRQSPEVIF